MDKRQMAKLVAFAAASTVIIYLSVCLCLSLFDLIVMLKQNVGARNVELGRARYEQLVARGIETEFSLYTEEEIKEEPNRAWAKLYYFPNDEGKRTKYAVIAPGGGYYECDVNKVAFPCAATFNMEGYTAFAIGYRAGKNSSKFAPLEDFCRAVEFITEHAETFNVETEDYVCVGYSAGANLVGLFADEKMGYGSVGVHKPGALLLAYPWVNINGEIVPTGNCFQELVAFSERLVGNKYLLGNAGTEEEKRAVCLQNLVNDAYPPTYIVQGDSDFVSPARTNADLLARALEERGVAYRYDLVSGVAHGFGLGMETKAEGWVKEGIAFWEEQTKR